MAAAGSSLSPGRSGSPSKLLHLRANARRTASPARRFPSRFCAALARGILGKKPKRPHEVAGTGEVGMRTVLAVVSDGTAASLLETALLVAKRFNARVTGLNALTAEYAVVFGGEMGFSISSEVDRTLEREGQDRREQARALFDAGMRRHGIGRRRDGVSAEWRERRAGRTPWSARSAASSISSSSNVRPSSPRSRRRRWRMPCSKRPAGADGAGDAACLDRRARAGWPERFHRDGAHRRLRHAVPEARQSVQVVSVEGARRPARRARISPRASPRHRRAGAACDAARPQPGDVFLDEAKAVGADLLVKGAYTQSRLPQMIFGGATSYIIMEPPCR